MWRAAFTLNCHIRTWRKWWGSAWSKVELSYWPRLFVIDPFLVYLLLPQSHVLLWAQLHGTARAPRQHIPLLQCTGMWAEHTNTLHISAHARQREARGKVSVLLRNVFSGILDPSQSVIVEGVLNRLGGIWRQLSRNGNTRDWIRELSVRYITEVRWIFSISSLVMGVFCCVCLGVLR